MTRPHRTDPRVLNEFQAEGLMVADQKSGLEVTARLQSDKRVNDFAGLRAAINIVAEKHEMGPVAIIGSCDVVFDCLDHLVQKVDPTVNVADGEKRASVGPAVRGGGVIAPALVKCPDFCRLRLWQALIPWGERDQPGRPVQPTCHAKLARMLSRPVVIRRFSEQGCCSTRDRGQHHRTDDACAVAQRGGDDVAVHVVDRGRLEIVGQSRAVGCADPRI